MPLATPGQSMDDPTPSNNHCVLSRRDVDFLLYEWLRVERLSQRPAFADHSRQTFDASLDIYETMAVNLFAPHNKKNDQVEPRMVNGRVEVNPEIQTALRAFAAAGLFAATRDVQLGGIQLPHVVERAGMAFIMAANFSSAAYAFLTQANVNLLLAYGTRSQQDRYAAPILDGRSFGTMCLSEPQAGSSLADISTKAIKRFDGSYRLFGSKMWISGGDHEMAQNIVHLVLAKIPDDD